MEKQTMEIGVGIVGIGWVAGEHIKSYGKNPHARVAALCTTHPQRTRDRMHEMGIERATIYDSYEAMLADPHVAAVSVCSPPNKHPEHVIKAARAGKHILIEKAAANDPASLGEMLRAVREAGVKTVVSFVLHWNPQFIWIRHMLRQGAIGRVFYAEADYWHNIGPHYPQYAWNVKKDIAGSSFLSAGCHAVDALRWFLQDEAEEVTAYSTHVNREYEYPPTVVGVVKFRSGAVGKLSSSLEVQCPYAFNIDLLGDKGTIRDNRIYSRDFFPGSDGWLEVPVIRPDSGDVTHHPFDGEIDHFVDCIQRGEESEVNLEDAAKTHALCYALDRSAAEGRQVRIEELTEAIERA